ncbi:hypothetical protein ACFQ7J_27270 [Streptomyces sp. NPDC056501]|uniref:hypothetical protein n=1 Tax=Streptomyces sp. NPDC056501 TaxID=3345841 RepID=UPI0036754DB3
MTRTIPLLHPLDDTGRLPRPARDDTRRLPQPLSDAGPELATATVEPQPATAADLSRYHHPHFLRVAPAASGSFNFYFRAFTGREARPETPREVWDDATLTWAQRLDIDRQYDVARSLWSQGWLRVQASPVLRKAGPLWEAWVTAQAELQQVFAAFWSTPDGMWRARLLQLTDAEQAALAAATAWDAVAEQLSKLAAAQRRDADENDDLPLEAVALELGLDASAWDIRLPDEYEPRPYSWGDDKTPMLRRLTAEIEQQRQRLSEVGRLAGELNRT